MSAPRSESWTVDCRFDRSAFDFEVILGGTYGDRSGRAFVHDPGETKVCHVWIHEVAESEAGAQGGAAVSRIEVLSPLTDDEIDEKRIEYDLASECQEQLTFALALYKPVGFVMIQTNDFLRFARNLTEFRVDRRHFLHARTKARVPDMDADVQRLLGMSSRSSARSFLADSSHVLFAADLFDAAFRRGRLLEEFRLVLLMTAAEALFTDSGAEIAYRLSLRMSMLNGEGADTRKKMFDLIRRCYDQRSRFVHGSIYSRNQGLLVVSRVDVAAFSNLVRSSLLYFIALSGYSKADLLGRLDAAVFDPGVVVDLRREANRFWGLGDSDEERLHVGKWNQ